jgi:DNA polymerase-1
MVAQKPIFVIDATFILEKTAKAFHGTPLLIVSGTDQTFCYGFFRDLLRLRAAMTIERGILAVGREGHDVASENDVASTISFAKEMGLSVVCKAERSVLDICYNLSTIATHLVTDDLKLLQLSGDRLVILMPKASNDWECLSPEAISAKTGVRPQAIPTFVALHDAKKGQQTASPLTKRQAIRLIELYGDINGIYANLESLSGSATREKLATSRDAVQKKYNQAIVDHRPVGIDLDPQRLGWEIDNERTGELLHARRFHSLVRLLPLANDFTAPEALESRENNEYVVVQDKEGLRRLESLLCAADLCALDCESDDKDPRKATLLGVALAVRKGEAFFLPVTESDLKGISKNDVIKVLNQVLTEQLRVVGHNVKYDTLLLLRHGIKINNIYFDTMLAAYDCYGDWDFFNLAYLSERLLGKRIKTYGDIVKSQETFLDLPLNEMTNHGCQDADISLQLHGVLDKELNTRRLREQYEDTTLALTRRLVEYEFQGLPVYLNKLEKLRSALLGDIAAKKEQIAEKLGRKIDLDSTKDLASVLKELLHLGAAFTSNSLSPRRLEELAISFADVRKIVEYKRLRRRLTRIESIAFSAKEGKIYPLFNQVRSPSGLLASTDPNLFEDDGLGSLKNCIDPIISEFYPARRTAIGCLQEASKDANFIMDWKWRRDGNHFMAQHPAMKELDHEELLLAIASGMSGPVMSRRFMLDRITIDSMIYDLKTRYGRLFDWLAEFREKALKQGYVTGPKGIKYLDGLKSPSVEKRKNSADAAVRWFISY